MRKVIFAVLGVCLASCASTSSVVTSAQTATAAAAPTLIPVPNDICSQLQNATKPPVIPVTSPIRVLAFGDFGTGYPNQKQVAQGIAKQAPYHFGVTLGDNFYPKGLASSTEPKWKSRWEDLYSPLNIRVYATLGNHDYYSASSPKAEMDRSNLSRTWCLPRPYYTFIAGPVQFFAIDTDPIERKLSSVPQELAWLKKELAASTATWKVVYGHHPIYTNGDHGEQMGYIPEIKDQLLPVLRDRANVYLTGHDHDLQALKPEGGVWFFVSGGGGETPRPLKTSACRQWAKSMNGFTVLDASEETLTISFFDADGKAVEGGRVELKKGASVTDCPR